MSGRVVPVYLRPTCSPFRWKDIELDTSDQMEFFHFIFPLGPARDIKFHWLHPSSAAAVPFAWRFRALYFTQTSVLDLLCLSIPASASVFLACTLAKSKDIQSSVALFCKTERKTRQIRKTSSRQRRTTTRLPE